MTSYDSSARDAADLAIAAAHEPASLSSKQALAAASQLADAQQLIAELAIRAAGAEADAAAARKEAEFAVLDKVEAQTQLEEAVEKLASAHMHEEQSIAELVGLADQLQQDNDQLGVQLAEARQMATQAVASDLEASQAARAAAEARAVSAEKLASQLQVRVSAMEAAHSEDELEITAALEEADSARTQLEKQLHAAQADQTEALARAAAAEAQAVTAKDDADAAIHEAEARHSAMQMAKARAAQSDADAEEAATRAEQALSSLRHAQAALAERRHLEAELRGRAAAAEHEAEAAAALAEGTRAALRGFQARLRASHESEMSAKQLANQLFAALEVAGTMVEEEVAAGAEAAAEAARLRAGSSPERHGRARSSSPQRLLRDRSVSPAKSVTFEHDRLSPVSGSGNGHAGGLPPPPPPDALKPAPPATTDGLARALMGHTVPPSASPAAGAPSASELALHQHTPGSIGMAAEAAAAHREAVRARAAVSAAASRQVAAETRTAKLEAMVASLTKQLQASRDRQASDTARAKALQAQLDELRWRVTVEGRHAGMATPSSGRAGSAAAGGPPMRGPLGVSVVSRDASGSPRIQLSSPNSRFHQLQHPKAGTAAELKSAILGMQRLS